MSVIEDIKSRSDIVDIISSYVPLQKAGRNFKVQCPFHSEKTPSFIVNPERQSWRCFGACATGGDIFAFVMRFDRVEFSEALRILAGKTGVILSKKSNDNREKHQALYKINEVTAMFFEQSLSSPQGEIAAKYLEARGVANDVAKRFRLGYSPNSWGALKSHLSSLNISLEEAVSAGVLYKSTDGEIRDFFRGRLMFPIEDKQGHISGFGARALEDTNPKYLNTAKRETFDKSAILYGLGLARDAIRFENEGVIVEGYMDVITAHQYGYTNVVASMGTALTKQQVAQLKPLAKTFLLALDPDNAGQEATLRSLESSWKVMGKNVPVTQSRSAGPLYQKEPMVLKIVDLPINKDPDSLIRDDETEWRRLTKEALPLIDYLIPVVSSRFDLETGYGKSQAVEALLPLIQSANFFDQESYLTKLSDVLGVREETLKASIGKLNTSSYRITRRQAGQKLSSEMSSILSVKTGDPLEEHLLALLLSKPELKKHMLDFDAEYFNNSVTREVFTQWLTCSTMDDLVDRIDESLRGEFDRLARTQLVPSNSSENEADLKQCMRRLEKRHLQMLQEQLLLSLDTGAPPPKTLEVQIADVNARLKDIFGWRVK